MKFYIHTLAAATVALTAAAPVFASGQVITRPGVSLTEAAQEIGGRALIVNAIDAEAEAFWRPRRFLPSRDDPLVLFRSIPDIAASIAEGEIV